MKKLNLRSTVAFGVLGSMLTMTVAPSFAAPAAQTKAAVSPVAVGQPVALTEQEMGKVEGEWVVVAGLVFVSWQVAREYISSRVNEHRAHGHTAHDHYAYWHHH